MDKRPVIVSACLLGLKTRYDCTDAYNAGAVEELGGRQIVPVCPEQLGGLPTPRPRAEISEGDGNDCIGGKSKVLDERSTDVTEKFLKGANEVLMIARLTGATEAYLKEKSPSCGVNIISKDNGTRPGMGVAAALLKREGIVLKGF